MKEEGKEDNKEKLEIKENKLKKQKKEKKAKKSKKIKKPKTKNKNSDPINNVVIFGFVTITIVFVIITLFILNVFNIKTKLTNKVVETLLSDKLSVEITRLEDEYNVKFENQFGLQTKKLSAMEQDLVARENDLKVKEQEIENDELEIEKTLADVNKKKEEIYGLVDKTMELSKIYGKMKAENAANILSSMEDVNLIRDIIFNIKEDQAAAILENMNPKIAAKITKERYVNDTEVSND